MNAVCIRALSTMGKMLPYRNRSVSLNGDIDGDRFAQDAT
jgi:hypothetical protein